MKMKEIRTILCKVNNRTENGIPKIDDVLYVQSTDGNLFEAKTGKFLFSNKEYSIKNHSEKDNAFLGRIKDINFSFQPENKVYCSVMAIGVHVLDAYAPENVACMKLVNELTRLGYEI